MADAIKTIGFGGVNCYLLAAGDGFLLIDTALATKRDALDTALARAGCVPGRLKLIVLTHGDVDHAGNAAHLRKSTARRSPCTPTTSPWSRPATPTGVASPRPTASP